MATPPDSYSANDPKAPTPVPANLAFYGYFLLTSAILLYILQPFLTTLMVAAVLAVWVRPSYLRLLRYYPRPNLLAVATTAFIVVAVLAPLGWALTKTFIQVGDVAKNVSDLVARPDRLAWLEPILAQVGALTGVPVHDLTVRMQEYLGQGAGAIVAAVGRGARDALGVTATMGLNLLILLFALFTFLVRAEQIVERFKRVSPLRDDLEDRLIRIFQGFSRGIVLGGFATALLQGIIAGVGYAIFGIDEAFFWGVMTALFSFVPFVGTALIWVPLAASLYFTGDTSGALMLAIYSVVLTGSVDNLVKPWLIGQESTLHPLLLFLSIFGGLMTIGAAGILVGPVAASFFLALAEVYEATTDDGMPARPSPQMAEPLSEGEDPSDDVGTA